MKCAGRDCATSLTEVLLCAHEYEDTIVCRHAQNERYTKVLRMQSSYSMVLRSIALWLAVSLPLALARAEPMDLDAFPAPGALVSVGAHDLHINCSGKGSPAVILDSGLGSNSLDWVRVQPEVEKVTRVCSYDRAGYGWSEGGPKPRTSGTIVSELSNLLTRGRVSPPYILVGHSFSGLTVRLFASRYPEKTAGLVLVDSAHERQFEKFRQAGIRNPFVPNGRRFMIVNHHQIPDGLPEEIRSIARALAASPDARRALYSELRHMRTSVQQLENVILPPDLPLVVVSHDARLAARSRQGRIMAELWMGLQRDLASRARRGSLVVVHRSGHYVQLDQPQAVVDAIRSIIKMSRMRIQRHPHITLTHPEN